jgi:hypothetical protein
MKKHVLVSLSVTLFLSAFFAGSISTASADESKVLQFDTMVGVPRPYTGAANAIRGVSGGGRPWVLDFAKGKLSADGDIDVMVRGLVIDPNEPVPVAGTNPSPTFKVIVSCLSTDASGAAVTISVSTGEFPADTAGNAHIKDTVALPQPCIAPIVFVTSATDAWFAATGF